MADSAAFEILYQEYYPRVFSLCRFLLPSEDCAEDAAQETFTRAYKNFGHYTPERPFWQWVAAIAHRYCVDQLRQRGRWQMLDADAQIIIDQLESPDPVSIEALITLEDLQHLQGAINELPDKYRVPLVLAYLANLSHSDIAELLDIKTNHVGVLLLRARQRLRTQLTLTAVGD
ncbi:MAG: sigma-70 family RNA polymerase sigma factor [Flavobacteriaceae bacterium]|jgi:RNA polymerase sigma-70 factor (ECF subfamily)